jgi:uncharacterized protein YaeQ
VAPKATIHHLVVQLSDVDRGVYETLDLRLARHPSEGLRYLITRTLAYCLSYEPGIAFSKGGLSATDEPPVSVRDDTGRLRAWIDVGAPSADRLHKAAKAADRVALFTHVDPVLLRREAATRPIHRVSEIQVHRLEADFLESLAARLEQSSHWQLARNDDQLYVDTSGATLEGALRRVSLDGSTDP